MRCPKGGENSGNTSTSLIMLFLLVSEPSSSNWEEEFCYTLNDCTRFSSFRVQAMLRYGDGLVGPSCIVFSIEFDKDGDLFALAGNTKIKVSR